MSSRQRVPETPQKQLSLPLESHSTVMQTFLVAQGAHMGIHTDPKCGITYPNPIYIYIYPLEETTNHQLQKPTYCLYNVTLWSLNPKLNRMFRQRHGPQFPWKLAMLEILRLQILEAIPMGGARSPRPRQVWLQDRVYGPYPRPGQLPISG